MNRIIALKGRGNSGKTTTINLLPDILLSRGYSRVPGMHRQHGADFIDVFQKGNLRLGVTSSGDTYDYVYDRLTTLVAANCQVCVCACRSRGGSVDATHDFDGYQSEFIQKTYAPDAASIDAINASDAQLLFSRI